MELELIWYGHACFAIKNKTSTIITDPFDSSLGFSLPPLQADIITISHDSPHHSAVDMIQGECKALAGPGEYEIKGIFITGQAFYSPKATEGRNICFIYDVAGVSICHLGDIGYVPTQSQLEVFDNVDILLVPVGDSKRLNAAKAAEVIGIIEPAVVVPMNYHLPNIHTTLDPLDKFLKEMGLNQIEAQPKLRISSGNLPEGTEIVVLAPKN